VTSAQASTSLMLHPEFEGCTSFGFQGARVVTVGCQYVFRTDSGTVDLKGCSNGGIIIESTSAFGRCLSEIPDQLGISSVSYATGGAAPSRNLLLTMNWVNTKVKVNIATGICPLTVGEHANGTYTGTTTVKTTGGEIWYG
jgi:hypothetical protein